jgi:KDO2-lipid IV(A) lauroyltransferase
LFSLIRKRRHITLTNLRLCLPHLSEAERVRIARQHFQMYARSVLERGILWWASERRLKRLIQVEPAVPLDVIQQGPTILMCPHFVCLDVAGVAVMLESSLCSIYTEQRNRFLICFASRPFAVSSGEVIFTRGWCETDYPCDA